MTMLAGRARQGQATFKEHRAAVKKGTIPPTSGTDHVAIDINTDLEAAGKLAVVEAASETAVKYRICTV